MAIYAASVNCSEQVIFVVNSRLSSIHEWAIIRVNEDYYKIGM